MVLSSHVLLSMSGCDDECHGGPSPVGSES